MAELILLHKTRGVPPQVDHLHAKGFANPPGGEKTNQYAEFKPTCLAQGQLNMTGGDDWGIKPASPHSPALVAGTTCPSLPSQCRRVDHRGRVGAWNTEERAGCMDRVTETDHTDGGRQGREVRTQLMGARDGGLDRGGARERGRLTARHRLERQRDTRKQTQRERARDSQTDVRPIDRGAEMNGTQ